MGGKYSGGRRRIRPAREQEAQKNQKAYYSGKKRRTLKTQVIVERNRLHIIDVPQAKGSVHDFKVYKDTMGKRDQQFDSG